MTDDSSALSEHSQPEWEQRLPPGQVAVVLFVNGGAIHRLDDVLVRIEGHVELGQMPLVLVHHPDVAKQIDAVLAANPSLRAVDRLETDDAATGFGDAFSAVLESINVRYLVALTLPKGSEIPRIASAAARRIRELGDLVEELEGPILLTASRTPRELVSRYVEMRMGAAHALGRADTEYLAALQFDAARPSLEAIDSRADSLELRIWLDARPGAAAAQPPWLIRVVLISGSQVVVRSEPARLSIRVDRHGVSRWDDLIVHLPLDAMESGHFRLALELESDRPELQRRRYLPPRQGAVVAARTVRIRDVRTNAVIGRYLLHTTGARRGAYLSVLRGAGADAERQWSRLLLKKDVRFILRGGRNRRMRWLRLARLVTKPWFRRRRIWLIGERRDSAQDNGIHLFRYLRANCSNDHVYYLMDRSSTHYERIRGDGNIVKHSSFYHQLLLLHVEVLANSNSIHYMIPDQWNPADYARHLAWRVGALRVYLKHGVHLSPNAVKRGSQGFDMVLTATARETEALRAVSGYSDQLVETGLPRYDALVPTPRSRTIVFMTTWRRYLVPKPFGKKNSDLIPFAGSEYEQFTARLLTSERLHRLLREHDYRLVFAPHYNLSEHFVDAVTAGERISIVDTRSGDLQNLLRECDGFITDYSSVHFDVAYLGTPIIYARFDEEEFEARHASPSWFNYETDGFGPVTHTLEETIDELTTLLQGGCVSPQRFRDRVESEFTYRDRQNSRRTVEAINARLDSLRR